VPSPKKQNFYSIKVTDENNIFVDMSQGSIKPNNQPKERMVKAAKECRSTVLVRGREVADRRMKGLILQPVRETRNMRQSFSFND